MSLIPTVFHPVTLKSMTFEFDAYVFYPVTLKSITLESNATVFYPVTHKSAAFEFDAIVLYHVRLKVGGAGGKGVVGPIIFQITCKSILKYDYQLPLR